MSTLSIGLKTFKNEIALIKKGLKEKGYNKKIEWAIVDSGFKTLFSNKTIYSLKAFIKGIEVKEDLTKVISYDFLNLDFRFSVEGKVFKKGKVELKNFAFIYYGLYVSNDISYKYYNDKDKLYDVYLKNDIDEFKKRSMNVSYDSGSRLPKVLNPKYDFYVFCTGTFDYSKSPIEYIFNNMKEISRLFAKKSLDFIDAK